VLHVVVVTHVEVNPVCASAGLHLTSAGCNPIHECPHALDALSAGSAASVNEVEQIENLASLDVAHDMQLWDAVGPVAGRCRHVPKVFGQGLDTVPQVNGKLTVDVIQVLDGDQPVEHVQGLEQQELHVTLTVKVQYNKVKDASHTYHSPFWRFTMHCRSQNL
jgi:hypothetical protein